MLIHEGYEGLKLRDPVVTLGIFDGVHRGHLALLNKLVARAEEINGESVVITFHPHPRLVLDKKPEGLFFLSTMEEKTELLKKANVGNLIIINFTPEFSKIKACDFVGNILSGKIGTRHLIVGYDHHFGYRGEGNFETINECAVSLGFVVEQAQGLHTGIGAISSSLIRDALLNGKLEQANSWLGYNYSLKGSVIDGRKIGRRIGFPTANIKPLDPNKLVPCNGVYAVEIVAAKDKILHGMLSIGVNPTVNITSQQRSIEVNIFDFEEDIYGRELEVIFRYRLRDEVKFGDTDQLAQQMARDEINARKLLG